MQHLTLEALARLVDEPPDAGESEHLAGCDGCRAELDAMRRETAALSRLGPIEPAGTEWAALEARLEHEGLIAGSAAGAVRRAVTRRWTARLVRLAAALALYAVGAATGLAMRGRPAAPVAVAPQATSPAPATTASPAFAEASPTETGAEAMPETSSATGAQAGAETHLVAAADGAATATTPEDAMRAVRAAEQAYLRAYSRYAELASGQQRADDPVARVAALESIVLTTREALDRAPADPVINGYHMTAVAQRDAALRQIALRSGDRWF